MTIHFARGKLKIGLRRKDWSQVWYEPIFEKDPPAVTEANEAPEIGLYPSSKKNAQKINDIMYGEVAWESFCEPKHFESNSTKERAVMQKQILYDTWRYLMVKDPGEVAIIRRQLEGRDPRRTAIVRESETVRKLRSRVVKTRRREAALYGRAAKSIETSDSESGYESDDSSDMPPPPRRGPRGPAPRQPSSGEAIDLTMMSGARGVSMSSRRGADDNEIEQGSRRNADNDEVDENNGGGSGGAGSQRPSASAPAPRGTKRQRLSKSESQQTSGPRIYQESGGVFMTPSVTQQHAVDGEERAVDEEERAIDDEDDNLLAEEGFNGGRNQDSAMAEAVRASRAASHLRDTFNGGRDDNEALRAGYRASMPADPLRNEAATGTIRGSNEGRLLGG